MFEAGLQSAHYKRRAALLSTLNELAAIEAAGGHSEISIAHWQAVLEFALNAPSSVAPKPLPTRLKFFEAYWESDHPRIGDCDIVTGSGWSQWLQQKLAGVDSDAPQPSDWEPLQSRAAVKSSEGEVWGVLGVDETLGAVDEPEAPLSLYDALGGSSSSTETSADGSRIEMVYSALHGYRIPMRVGPTDDETTSAFYLKILGELREENGTAAAEAAKADKAARKTLKPAKIGPDDPFVECA